MTTRAKCLLIASLLALLLTPAVAVAGGGKQQRQADWRQRASTWLNPVRYHSNSHGRMLVEYGLENGRRVTLGATRQLSTSKAHPDGAKIQTVYGRLRVDGRSHPSRLRSLRTPDGVVQHTLVVRGFNNGEVTRLKDGGFDVTTIKAGTLKLDWQEKDQAYRPLTAVKGIGKVLWGSKVARGALLLGMLGGSAYTFGLLHTAQAAVSLKLASMASDQKAVRQIGAIADFRPRGVQEQRLSTRIPGVSDAVSSMQNAAP